MKQIGHKSLKLTTTTGNNIPFDLTKLFGINQEDFDKYVVKLRLQGYADIVALGDDFRIKGINAAGTTVYQVQWENPQTYGDKDKLQAIFPLCRDIVDLVWDFPAWAATETHTVFLDIELHNVGITLRAGDVIDLSS